MIDKSTHLIDRLTWIIDKSTWIKDKILNKEGGGNSFIYGCPQADREVKIVQASFLLFLSSSCNALSFVGLIKTS